MEEKLYNVIFLGPVNNGGEGVNELKERLIDHFKLSIESVSKMIKLAPIEVKRGVSFEEAAKYRVVLESLGAQVRLEPVGNTSMNNPGVKDAKETGVSKRENASKKFNIWFIIIVIAFLIILGMIIIGIYRG
jgi:hypothetical protein